MKKLTLVIVLILTLLLSGCSCGGRTVLKFDSKWGGNNVGYTEQLTYTVKYADDYTFGGYDFTKTNTLPTLQISASGTYVVKNEILSLSSTNIAEEVKSSPLVSGMPYVIKSSTLLTLSIDYSLEGTEYSCEEFIATEGYFCPPEGALAPIISAEYYDYSLPKISEKFILERVVGENVITYGQENYTTVQKLLDAETGELVTKTERTFNYEPKTVIDNTSFLFSLRNLDFTNITETIIPVVHSTYGEAQDLRVNKFENSDLTLDLTIDGQTNTQLTIPTNVIKYAVSSDDKAGANQIIFVQNNATSQLTNNALIVKYVSPFSDYDGFRKLGALVYTLNSITYFS